MNASAASHAGSPGRGGSPTRQLRASMGGAQLQSEVNQLHADNMALRQEVALLSQQAAEVRRCWRLTGCTPCVLEVGHEA